jgi:hypothetical protein
MVQGPILSPVDDRYLEFVHLHTYRRSTAKLLDDHGQRAIEEALVQDPEAGDVIAGTGGVRKLRFGFRGRGKRGGVRLIYYYRSAKGRVYLILMYPKARKEDLTAAECATMKALTAEIEREP